MEMTMCKNKVNLFLLQRQVAQSIKSLPKEKQKLLGQAYINVLNDFKVMSMYDLRQKYFGKGDLDVEEE